MMTFHRDDSGQTFSTDIFHSQTFSANVNGDAAESFRGQSVVEMELVLVYKRGC